MFDSSGSAWAGKRLRQLTWLWFRLGKQHASPALSHAFRAICQAKKMLGSMKHCPLVGAVKLLRFDQTSAEVECGVSGVNSRYPPPFAFLKSSWIAMQKLESGISLLIGKIQNRNHSLSGQGGSEKHGTLHDLLRCPLTPVFWVGLCVPWLRSWLSHSSSSTRTAQLPKFGASARTAFEHESKQSAKDILAVQTKKS